METLGPDLEKDLLDSIRGEGEDVVFSQKDIEEERENYLNSSQESIRNERYRNAKARTSASKIYLD